MPATLTPHTPGTTAPVTSMPLRTIARRALLRAKRLPGARAPKGGCVHQLTTETGAGTLLGLAFSGPAAVTATWRYAAPKHIVSLGTDTWRAVGVAPRKRAATSDADAWTRHLSALADALLRHECGHGRHTDRDIPRIVAAARCKAVPFAVVNAFEDARIEAKERARTGEKLEWTRWYAPAPTDRPLVAFLNHNIRESTAGPSTYTPSLSDAKVIARFWERATACPDTDAIVDLAAEWCAHWRTHGVPDDKAQTVPTGTPRASGQIGTDDDSSADGIVPEGNPDAPAPDASATSKGKLGDGAVTAPTVTSAKQPYAYFQRGGRTTVDGAQADRIAARLARIITASASPTTARTATSGSRLHIPAVATGRSDAFRAPGRTGGRPRVVIVYDMSGSMDSDHRAHGSAFLAAFLRIGRRGVADVRAILTGNGQNAVLPTNITDEELSTLTPNCGCESVAVTLEAHRAAVESAHVCVVYTDAMLTDGPVHAATWRARGADVIGACVAPTEYAESVRGMMAVHFGANAIAPSGEELACKLAGMIGDRARHRC